jgi:hypothetical protein
MIRLFFVLIALNLSLTACQSQIPLATSSPALRSSAFLPPEPGTTPKPKPCVNAQAILPPGLNPKPGCPCSGIKPRAFIPVEPGMPGNPLKPKPGC